MGASVRECLRRVAGIQTAARQLALVKLLDSRPLREHAGMTPRSERCNSLCRVNYFAPTRIVASAITAGALAQSILARTRRDLAECWPTNDGSASSGSGRSIG